ncbi:MAG: DUF6527 family protein [Pseudomonadota bacterium]
MVLKCPDGCGETLTINLDPRAAKAWRFYRRRNQVSIFPSIWRDTGCRSHFIIWHHVIDWCDWGDSVDDVEIEDERELLDRALAICTHEWQHFTNLAEKLDAIPWDVNRVCRSLVNDDGVLEQGIGENLGFFRLANMRTF